MTAPPSVDELLAAGFAMGGERLAALDLADTVMLVADPVVDLIDSEPSLAKWWDLQATRLPAAPVPDASSVRRLRAAIRDVLDSHLAGRMPQPTSIEDLNATTAAAPASLRMVMTDDGLQTETRWHSEYGGNAALAAMARETIELLADPETLRRCANPNCSMLFLAEHKRRQFCIGTRCGNRTRVARHYQKAKQS